ncbi:hypothetical protein KIN20_009877 [Parelaphostrongylus tenuis]|uniref:Uncharacterized protein n=1 Tax=Parelaphostrongylus tenuis TaxID=148309 RepID=A0AAD5QIH1_PARTN|nr:hypothetical protein KIN20_009877 [Parelaphostrongylus tenuis]
MDPIVFVEQNSVVFVLGVTVLIVSVIALPWELLMFQELVSIYQITRGPCILEGT